MGRLGLGHMVKDGKMVSVQNKKIALALNAVIGINSSIIIIAHFILLFI